MARGIAKVAADYSIRNVIEVEMLKDDFDHVSHLIAEEAIQSRTGLFFETTVVNEIYNLFPSNNYNGGYFFDFDCTQCRWSTGIYSPNIGNVNIDPGTILYVVPSMEDVDLDSIRGYFTNNTGQLDSTWVDEDFLDSHYVWVVTSSSDCHKTCSDEGSGNNGRETEVNCPDYGSHAINNSLYLLSYKMENDHKGGSPGPQEKYQEGWIRNRYELALQTLLYRPILDGTGQVVGHSYITGSRTSDDPDDTDVNPTGRSIKVNHDKHDLKILKVGRGASDVTRCKIKRNGNKKCSGNNTQFSEKELISRDCQPGDIFYFVMYERDKNYFADNIWLSPDIATTVSAAAPNIKRRIFFKSQIRPYIQNDIDGNAFRIDENSVWQAETIDGVNYITCTETLDGEITVKFGYTSN